MERRWVYLHYFKDGQPSINWLDPTFAGHAAGGRRRPALARPPRHERAPAGRQRLPRAGTSPEDGARPGPRAIRCRTPSTSSSPASSASSAGSRSRSSTWPSTTSGPPPRRGADLSYDFVNRPAYHHALATGDTEFLRLTLNSGCESGRPPGLARARPAESRRADLRARALRDRHTRRPLPLPRRELTGAAAGRPDPRASSPTGSPAPAAPYNAVFTTNGIASTTATVIAAVARLPRPPEPDGDRSRPITRAHLLLAMFNAWQPGVFALSGWDLCGDAHAGPGLLGDLIADGDTRWIHRGAYDLMNYRPDGGEQPSATAPRRLPLRTAAGATGRPHLVRLAAAAHPSGP